jgi:hypothetical protein
MGELGILGGGRLLGESGTLGDSLPVRHGD